MDMLEDLESLQFESGVTEEDRSWLYLQGRSRGLTVEACAHAIFFCKLVHTLRESLNGNQSFRGLPIGSLNVATDEHEELKVGIIGGGHLGKQLARVLLQLVPLPAESLRISTRRPEALVEFQKQGVRCFYHNSGLVGWANVVFLCCLPSQLPNICIEIQNSIRKACIVFSFVAAIPLPRLKLLLNKTSILRPQYHYHYAEDGVNIWGAKKEITAALQDPVILQATCPYSAAGGIRLNIKWLEGVFYAALNICTEKNVAHSKAMLLMNELFLSVHFQGCGEDTSSCPKFQLTDVVSKDYVKNLSGNRPFPWFELTTVQLRETPFSQCLSASTVIQDHLTHLYCDSFGISPSKEQPNVSTGLPSQ
ncbi:NADP-dependent oxidoreductase domain-containing protein 1 isoform X1 [Oryctolagus cuniculus]|uniref:NADP-dependent oxidoreductase domain-containing protein 1 n=1 Tax=Oryctolagus cuniculus TaxID=9986 RepID=G1SRX3_RABIT|nr:NADP-dependent oxidoreductase domain-containing protein 1 isoform X1 [Oryctolagus cuniculus]